MKKVLSLIMVVVTMTGVAVGTAKAADPNVQEITGRITATELYNDLVLSWDNTTYKDSIRHTDSPEGYDITDEPVIYTVYLKHDSTKEDPSVTEHINWNMTSIINAGDGTEVNVVVRDASGSELISTTLDNLDTTVSVPTDTTLYTTIEIEFSRAVTTEISDLEYTIDFTENI